MNERSLAGESGNDLRQGWERREQSGFVIGGGCRIQNYSGGWLSSTLDASYYKGPGARNGKEREFLAEEQAQTGNRKYIVRRLTPMECARLQGFEDDWGEIKHYSEITEQEQEFWEKIRKQNAETYGKRYKPFKTKLQMMNWLNNLRTDSAEYKAYGNSLAIPCAEFVMGGIVDLLRKEELENEREPDSSKEGEETNTKTSV